jgi:hypothetical protein
MLAAAITELIELEPVRIIAPVLLGGVITFLAIVALQRYHRADIFPF